MDPVKRKTKKELKSKFVGCEATKEVEQLLAAEAEAMGVRVGQEWVHPEDRPSDPPIKIACFTHRYIIHDMHPGAHQDDRRDRLVQKDAPYAQYYDRGLAFSISCATLVSTRSPYKLVVKEPND